MTAPTIRQILEAQLDEGIDLDDPAEVANLLLGDGEGGEGVDYRHGDTEGEIAFTKTWGTWVLRHGRCTGTWAWDFTPYETRSDAKAAYIAAIEAKQAEGVTWAPDYCPIFDQIEATWK